MATEGHRLEDLLFRADALTETFDTLLEVEQELTARRRTINAATQMLAQLEEEQSKIEASVAKEEKRTRDADELCDHKLRTLWADKQKDFEKVFLTHVATLKQLQDVEEERARQVAESETHR
jgi:hypothetical protein